MFAACRIVFFKIVMRNFKTMGFFIFRDHFSRSALDEIFIVFKYYQVIFQIFLTFKQIYNWCIKTGELILMCRKPIYNVRSRVSSIKYRVIGHCNGCVKFELNNILYMKSLYTIFIYMYQNVPMSYTYIEIIRSWYTKYDSEHSL